MMFARRLAYVLIFSTLSTGCGDDDQVGPDAGVDGSTLTLDDFLPELPQPTGGPQTVFAGAITPANAATERIPGPASTGLAGDFYIRSSKARFVIQSASRAIGVIPWGGNLIDATRVGAGGVDLAPDHFGEIAVMYQAGRTCAHTRVDVLLDGSGGGPAVIRARGRADVNDFINLKGMAVLPLPDALDPGIADGVDCATTYTLQPDSTRLEIAWTLFNGGDYPVDAPLAAVSDSGGVVKTFAPEVGFHLVSKLEDLAALAEPSTAPYDVVQGPGIAYALFPRYADPATHSAVVTLLGVNVVLYNGDGFLDLLNETKHWLHLPRGQGVTHGLDVLVGHDAGDLHGQVQAVLGVATTAVSGTVRFMPSNVPATGARVGVFRDLGGDGAIDAADPALTFFDAAADGAWAGALPAGAYLLRADVIDVARSAAVPLTVAATPVTAPPVVLADLASYEFSVVDDATGAPMPAKLTVVGPHPVPLDKRLEPPDDRTFGIVRTVHGVHGLSTGAAPGDPADGPLLLPAALPGKSFRIYASHGPEWSIDSALVSPTAGQTGMLTFRLRRVVDTAGYLASEFHQHADRSPDSSAATEDRLKSLAVEGIEFFASTDHDFLFDYDPLIDQHDLRGWIDGVIGVESTPFAWGHFIAWPLVPDPADPSGGAPDWATGSADGLDMLPSELWTSLRQKGAQLVQVCHPRALGSVNFQHFFDRVGLTFDYAGRAFHGRTDLAVPAAWLRLPEDTDLFSPAFDVLEVWNGFSPKDTDGDGVPELQKPDLVLRDYFNFLSFGKAVAPIGNSDTHTVERDPAGLPRTLIRVPADDAAALLAGVEDDVYATLLGSGAPKDIVVSNGPMLRVSADGGASSAIGQVVTPTAGAVTLTIEASSAEWVDFDTIEVFANATPDPVMGSDAVTALQPLACFSTRSAASMAATDPCLLAPWGGGPQAMTTMTVDACGPMMPACPPYKRRVSTVTIVLNPNDIVNRMGAQPPDAWVVVRVRGQRAMFPILPESALEEANLDAVVAAASPAAMWAAVGDRGVPAAAFTAPVLIDFDGNGYRAPFAP